MSPTLLPNVSFIGPSRTSSSAINIQHILSDFRDHMQSFSRTPGVDGQDSRPVVVLDSLTAVAGLLGPESPEMDRLVRGVQSLCAASCAPLVIVRHCDVRDEEAGATGIAHASDLVVSVRPLETGRAMDVHGQVIVESRRGPCSVAARTWFSMTGTGGSVRFVTGL